MTETRSTCCYCGVGCGVIVSSADGRITGVRGDPEHPANHGRLCSKGQTLHLTAAPGRLQARLLQPQRRPQRGTALEPVAWDTAMDELATRLAQAVQQHGPDSVGLYLSGQLLTEDYYVFNKLGRALLRTNNVDTNSRLCMSSAVAGYKHSLGSDAVPCCYDDIDAAATVFVTGSNLAWAHPVLMRRLEDARAAAPGLKLIVADPRRTETAAMADLHLPLLPGTDVVLHHAMLHVMLWEDLIDRDYIAAHTSGFEALRERVREFSPAHAARICGLKADDIVQAARWFANVDPATSGNRGAAVARRPTLSLYCQGLNQSISGTDKNRTLINLHLVTGQIGRPGAGPLSLTGQPNAMGGREVGALAHQLVAHRELASASDRAEVAALWGVASLPERPGKAAVQLFEAAADGALRVLWIACTNPAQSLPDQALVRRALERCEFVVLQEAFQGTATAAWADLLLPATTWGEREGTVTNSERRISRVRASVPPPGEARHDWVIARDVAQRLERLLPVARAPGQPPRPLFAFDDAEAVWLEHRLTTAGRDLDITGLDWRQLEAAPQQWPFEAGATRGRERLYTDGRFATPDGRARLAAPAWRPTAEVRSAMFPISLTTGRLRDQWHGMSRTGLLGRLFAHGGEPCVQLHPQELARRHWAPGELVRVRSRSGELVLPVQPSESVPPAQAFIAMHWGSEFVSGAGVNALLPRRSCPDSQQPELKHAAVRIERAVLPWRLVAAAWCDEKGWFERRQALRALFGPGGQTGEIGQASCVPFGREPEGRIGLLFRAAAAAPPDCGWMQALETALGLHGAAQLRYDDARAGQSRVLRLGADGTLQAFVLGGEVAAESWMLSLLQRGDPAAAIGRALLLAGPRPPREMPPRSAQVCTCHDVGQASIAHALSHCDGTDEQRLRQLQDQLGCGTSCGSCLPALRALVRTVAAAVQQ